MFKTNSNIFINADINASLNILKLGKKNSFNINKNIFFPKIIDL
jgi:transposase